MGPSQLTALLLCALHTAAYSSAEEAALEELRTNARLRFDLDPEHTAGHTVLKFLMSRGKGAKPGDGAVASLKHSCRPLSATDGIELRPGVASVDVGAGAGACFGRASAHMNVGEKATLVCDAAGTPVVAAAQEEGLNTGDLLRCDAELLGFSGPERPVEGVHLWGRRLVGAHDEL
eukprot:TRINITY_DN11113_c0_g1_i1.p3 TRINITY_DN11113_c0_g1~~TRINITY_DN11113_c0_g1_i1.p3  ORF type:complete len:176 (+),score=46.55 TRINITY_DN11113_c0_g1_i1:59-586(+)